MKHVYLRCNDGHLFLGETCPFDAWGSPETVQLNELIKRIDPNEYSIDRFRAEGVNDELLRRVMVAEFGDERAVFDGLAPEYYVVDGKKVFKYDIDDRFL